jgi:phospholipid/cholesterol/gamma-HCH transport system substrate-binding protein
MAQKLTQAAKVGIFLVVMGAAGYAVYRTLSPEIGHGGTYRVYGFIDDATGLVIHSRVTMSGIPVGSIEEISLEGGAARVDIAVSKDVHLHQTAMLGIKSASLLGENIIYVVPGTGEPDKKDGDRIETVPSARSFDSLKDQLGRIADLIEKVATQIAATIGSDEGRKQMQSILKNVAEATEAINLMVNENRIAIHDTLANINKITAQGAPEVQTILANVKVVTENVKELLARQGGAGPDGGTGELQSTIERVNRASKSLESTLEHADHISERIDKGEGTLGRLSKDDALINEVQGVAEGVNDYVDRLVRLQTVVGLRTDYNFLANTIKSYVSLRLQPREDKYYIIELINDPRGKTSFTQTDVDTTNPNEPSHYRTVTTTTTDAFRFTLQFARRLGPFTGRFGIKESTGGIGLDIHLLSNRFEITNDLFGFGEEISPRYRVYLGYEFIKRLWLLGGVDHMFLPDQRDYFLGLQLRFTDDDLKTILPFASGASAAGGR